MKKNKIVAIVQARWNSSRFPGKVLKLINNETVLKHVFKSLKSTKLIDEICCAMPNDPSSKPIALEAKKFGAKTFFGEEKNVLKRFYDAASQSKADIIIRVTSDCPLTNPIENQKVINKLLSKINELDYVSNNLVHSYPHGLDCEAFTFNALKTCFLSASSDYDLEHVTPWIRKSTLKKENVLCQINNVQNIRLTLDFEEDYVFLRRLFKFSDFNDYKYNLPILIKKLYENKSLFKINDMHKVNRTKK